MFPNFPWIQIAPVAYGLSCSPLPHPPGFVFGRLPGEKGQMRGEDHIGHPQQQRDVRIRDAAPGVVPVGEDERFQEAVR